MDNPFVAEIVRQVAGLTSLEPAVVEDAIAAPRKAGMGDYAFPCFMAAKGMRRKPNEIAAEVASGIEANDLIEHA